MSKTLVCICLFALLYISPSFADLFLVNQIDSQAVYLNNIDRTIIPIKLPRTAITQIPADIEAGVIVDISCSTPTAVSIFSATASQSDSFNARYEQILQRIISYDASFLKTIYQAYQKSPSENLLLKAILSSTVSSQAFANLQRGQNPYSFADSKYLCLRNTAVVNAGPLDRDRQFLVQLGKDIVSGTRIISRQQRGANENLSKPYPPSSGTTTTSTSNQGEVSTSPTLNDTIRTNYLLNFQDIDQPRTVQHKVNSGWRSMEYFPADRIIIHHTAGKLAKTKEEGMKYMQSVHNYHGKTLGRGDIGYHYLIDGAGNIYEGRRGGMDVVGAHVLGHNRGSVGISLMSDGEYPIPMLASLVELTLYLGEHYGIDVTRKAEFKNRDLTDTEQSYPVVAHKELTPRKPDDPKINMDGFRKLLGLIQNNPKFKNSIKQTGQAID